MSVLFLFLFFLLFSLSLSLSHSLPPSLSLSLSLCFSTSPGRVKFESESPDESALVAAAQVYGYTLLSRAKDWYVKLCHLNWD